MNFREMLDEIKKRLKNSFIERGFSATKESTDSKMVLVNKENGYIVKFEIIKDLNSIKNIHKHLKVIEKLGWKVESIEKTIKLHKNEYTLIIGNYVSSRKLVHLDRYNVKLTSYRTLHDTFETKMNPWDIQKLVKIIKKVEKNNCCVRCKK